MKQKQMMAQARTPRERLWDAIRARNGNEFMLAHVADEARMKTDAARDYLAGLRRAGFVTEVRRERVKGSIFNVFFCLTRDVGHEAPSVNRAGELLRPREVNTQMWQSLRICGVVNARALANYASTDEVRVTAEHANFFLQTLRRAGYVEVVKPSSYANQATYRLLPHMNTGPKPPQICRAARVYDANTGQVVYQEQPELAEEIRDGVTGDE